MVCNYIIYKTERSAGQIHSLNMDCSAYVRDGKYVRLKTV